MPSFNIEVHHLDGEAVVRFAGALDIEAVPELKRVVRPLLARYDADQLVLDWAALERVDDDGLGALVHTFSNRPGGTRPRLANARPQVQRVLEAAGCDDLFDAEDVAV